LTPKSASRCKMNDGNGYGARGARVRASRLDRCAVTTKNHVVENTIDARELNVVTGPQLVQPAQPRLHLGYERFEVRLLSRSVRGHPNK
jgi:hypothetical protein